MPAKKYFYFFLLPMILIFVITTIALRFIFESDKGLIWWLPLMLVYFLPVFIFTACPAWLCTHLKLKKTKKYNFGLCTFTFLFSSYFAYIFIPDNYVTVKYYDIDYMSQHLQEGHFKFSYHEPINARYDIGKTFAINIETNSVAYLSCFLSDISCGDVRESSGNIYKVKFYKDPHNFKKAPKLIIFEIEDIANRDTTYYVKKYKKQQDIAWVYLFFYSSIYILANLTMLVYFIKE